MQNFIGRRLVGINNIFIVLWVPTIFFINSCQEGHIGAISPNIPTEQQDVNTNDSTPSEIILFCGNPGVGKSSLCNSIFNKTVFESGVSLGGGMTIKKQEYVYENTTYIDTPGLSSINRRKEAAEEIEAALKKNNNYKVIFVLTLEAGRFRPDDFVTINVICDAITVHFEYGIIINKLSNAVDEEIKAKGGIEEALKPYLDLLSKKVSLKNLLILKKDREIEDVNNACLTDSAERSKLVNFISELEAHNIKSEDVQKIDVTDYEEKAQALQEKLDKVKQIPEYSMGGQIVVIAKSVFDKFIDIIWYNPTGQQDDSETKETATDRTTDQQYDHEKYNNYERDDIQINGTATNDNPIGQQDDNQTNETETNEMTDIPIKETTIDRTTDTPTDDLLYNLGSSAREKVETFIEKIKENAEETSKSMENKDWSEFP